MTLFVGMEIQLEGFYRLQVLRDEEVRQDTGWFKNLITNQGLDFVGCLQNIVPSIGQFLNDHCGVGTGTTAPAFTDTQLATPLAMFPGTGLGAAPFPGLAYHAGPPPYWSSFWNYQFPLGAVVGNVSEVGVGNASSTATTPRLFSRCLILDSLGNPTVISVTALDVLVVTYELRYYIDTSDNTYSIVIDGTFGPVTYGGTYRRQVIGSTPLIYFPVLNAGVNLSNANSYVYSGFTLGPITGNPTYINSRVFLETDHTSAPYINASYYADITLHVPLSAGNFVGGINGFTTVCNHGSYQFSISPAIPKTASYVLDMTWRVSWSRYP